MVIRATLPSTSNVELFFFLRHTCIPHHSGLKKLTRDNYRLWRAQVLPAIQAAQLEGFIDGSEKTHVWNQHVLTYLITSLSHEVLTGVTSNCTSTDMWAAITKSFASQSCLSVLHLHNQLVATCKGDQSDSMHFSTMQGYTDEMVAAGKPLDDDDVV
jgi:hypothetical protein